MNVYKSSPSEGVYLFSLKTDKFKSAYMTVSFALPLEKETASGYSLLSNLLSLSTGDYPTMQAFSVAKDEMYALGMDAYVQRRGEILFLTLEINTLGDSYTFDNERLLYRAAELLGGAIFRPHLENGAFPEKNVESEKKCLIEEISSEIENKPAYALRRAREILCENEPFAVDAAGDIERVSALDGRELMRFYRNALDNAPVYIVYAGEADAGYVEECVRAFLPFSPRKAALPIPVEHEKIGEIKRVREKMDMGQSVLIIGFSLEMPHSARQRAVLSVYDEIFGSSPASKLFVNVREKDGLCYYCSSYPSGRKNVMFVSCGPEPGCEAQAEAAILNAVKEMANGDFSDEDFENAKRSVINAINETESSLSSAISYIAGQATLEDALSPEESASLIASVTREEVIKSAKTVSPELIYILGDSE